MKLAKKDTLDAIGTVLASRKLAQALQLFDPKFPKQESFVKDASRLKALFCTRRAAKSYSGGLALVEAALMHPNTNHLFIGLTRESAKGIIWKDVLLELDRKHELGMQFNKSALTATLPNGSVIWATGIDVAEEEMNKLLGRKYKTVVIDEASMYSIDLRNLVYGILKPAMADMRGTIYMVGTSSNITKGLFYDITTGAEPGWALYTWTAHDNPFVAKQWQEELDDIKANRPLYMETAQFKQWYLNQWVVDEAALVYRFNPNRNTYAALPHAPKNQWNYVLGVDLGYEDDSAFVLCAFNNWDKVLHIAEVWKAKHMDITDVANRIKDYQSKQDIYRVVIDGANKQAVQEIQKRHGVALATADKTGKSDFIQIMNDEFTQGKIRLNTGCSALMEEYMSLVWVLDGDKPKEPRRENPICSNHLTDAALYAWRYCYQFLSEAPKPRVQLKEQWAEHTKQLMEDHLEKQIQRQQAEEAGQDMWDTAGLEEEDVLKHYLNKRKQ
jgi:phage terminase large subunit